MKRLYLCIAFGEMHFIMTSLSQCFGGDDCGNSSVGRAQPCQGWGRGSESRFPLDLLEQQEVMVNFVIDYS